MFKHHGQLVNMIITIQLYLNVSRKYITMTHIFGFVFVNIAGRKLHPQCILLCSCTKIEISWQEK